MIIEDTRLEATKRIYKLDRGIKKLGRNLLEEFERWQRENPEDVWSIDFSSRVDSLQQELDEENQRLTWMADNDIKRMRGPEVWEEYEKWKTENGLDMPKHITFHVKQSSLDKAVKHLQERKVTSFDPVERETVEEAEAADRKATEPVSEAPKPRGGGRVAGQPRPVQVEFELDAPASVVMKAVEGHKLVWVNRLASKKGALTYEEDTVPFASKHLSLTEHVDGRRTLNFSGISGFRALDLNDLIQVR